MGSAQSTIDPRYIRIWNNLSTIESPQARIQMLETLFAGHEYVYIAKQTGVYASLLQWIACQRRGEFAIWPNPFVQVSQPQQSSFSVPSHAKTHTAIASIPPPKRALDVLTESYIILGIDDTKPLTHELLKAAYKRAAIQSHPDKGGSSEKFDAVTKAFLYIQEVLEKLIPKTTKDGVDPRFHVAVTPESALRARGVSRSNPGTRENQIEDKPPIALNPKKLDMNVFNQLFEENRLPDPDKDDGYGDWLKSNTDSPSSDNSSLRSKFNKDIFHKTFEEETRKQSGRDTTVSTYRPPSELVLAPEFGAELGGGRPEQYTKQPSSNGIGYTDLKFAYGKGSTFSQDIANVPLGSKTLEQAKREYGSAPKALGAEESAAILALERAKEAAEEMRRRRLAVHDVDAEHVHERLQKRLTIQN